MKKIILFWLYLFPINIVTKASHIAGADLTYQCLGAMIILLLSTFYDCSGIDADLSALIYF